MNENNYVLLNKSFMEIGSDMSNDALLVYTILKLNCYKSKEIFLNNKWLEWLIFGKRKTTQAEKNAVKRGVLELIEYEYVNILYAYDSYSMVCDISNILKNHKDEQCVQIFEDELKNILLIEDVNKFNMFKLFASIISKFNTNTNLDKKFRNKIMEINLGALACIVGVSITTLCKYMSLLEDNKIIYVTRRKLTVRENDNIKKQMNNLYCRYEDRNICEEYVTKSGFVKKNKEYVNIGNKMRSYAQQYNCFCRYKDKNKYTIDQIRKIYKQTIEYNEYKQDYYNQCVEKGCKVKRIGLKDLSVFDEYKNELN